MSKIINFPTNNFNSTEDKDDWFIIETSEKTKWAKNLESIMDELWSEIYCGKEITNVFADDDGRIHFHLEFTGRRGSYDLYKEHFKFLVDYINRTYSVADFMKEYNTFIETADIEKLLTTKQKSPTSDQEE